VLNDIVIDSNVLAHADNPTDGNHESSTELLRVLLASETLLCVDREFAFAHGNTSLIGQEYLETVGFGGTGYATLLTLMATSRIKSVPMRLPRDEAKIIEALIRPSKPRDRTFVRVAANSDERTFVSHDWEDFTASVRRDLKRRLAIDTLEASDALSSF